MKTNEFNDNGNYVIAVGRSFGSGGLKLANILHNELDIPVYDKNILEKASEYCHIRKEIFEKADEKSEMNMPYVFGSGYPMPNSFFTYSNDYLSNDNLFVKQSETIEELASHGSAIFVGRASDFVLRDHPRLLSIFITEDPEIRVQNIIERLSVKPDEARSMMEKMDKNRRDYYNYYTNRQWGSAENYDLCLKLSKFGTDYAVTLIKEAVRMLCDSVPDQK